MHYLAWVVVDADGDIDAQVQSALAPYDYNLAVAYESSDCWCYGQTARAEVAAWAEAHLVDLRAEMAHGNTDGNVLIRTRIDVEIDARVRAHPGYDQPDAACPECDGSGITQDAYNPEGQWDWWETGGRWSGACDPDGEDDVLRPERAVASLTTTEVIPDAVIDHQGVWHADPNGLFGSGEGGEWIARVESLLAAAGPGRCVVVVDCHT